LTTNEWATGVCRLPLPLPLQLPPAAAPDPVAINPLELNFEFDGRERQQYPLVLAFAITLHKAQGLTLNAAVVDLGRNMFGGCPMAYTALSRVRSSDDVLILEFADIEHVCNRVRPPSLS
jgi:hypothetical protein